ncbi:hypothetical protein EDD11_000459 [Mortierella claussenii]|nr:hypothetical protein EDD11_000459 [Mortierella claussenii]
MVADANALTSTLQDLSLGSSAFPSIQATEASALNDNVPTMTTSPTDLSSTGISEKACSNSEAPVCTETKVCSPAPASALAPASSTTHSTSTTSDTTSNTTTPGTLAPTLATTPFLITRSSIRLDITSDTTCPWCFITKRRLDRAMSLFHALSPEAALVQFDIHWHPYQLDPRAPAVPILKSALYARKFGPERATLVRDRVMKAAHLEGIEFKSADQSLYCSTLDSHRLVKYARERLGRRVFEQLQWTSSEEARRKERRNILKQPEQDHHEKMEGNEEQQEEQEKHEEDKEDKEDEKKEEKEEGIDDLGNLMEDAMVEELFQSHFERGECGDLPTLQRLARKVLLNVVSQEQAKGNIVMHSDGHAVHQDLLDQEVHEVEEYLASEEDLQEIKDSITVAKRDLGIQGVPTTIVQNTYLLSGGQDPLTFVEIFKRVV